MPANSVLGLWRTIRGPPCAEFEQKAAGQMAANFAGHVQALEQTNVCDPRNRPPELAAKDDRQRRPLMNSPAVQLLAAVRMSLSGLAQ